MSEKCELIINSKHVMPGWGCCKCRTYNGIQRESCRSCNHKCCVEKPKPETFGMCNVCGVPEGMRHVPMSELRIYQHHPLCSNLPTSPIGGYGCACRIEFGAPKPSLSSDLDDPETWRGLYDELEPASGATPSVDLAAQTQTAGSALSTERLTTDLIRAAMDHCCPHHRNQHDDWVCSQCLCERLKAALKDLPAAKFFYPSKEQVRVIGRAWMDCEHEDAAICGMCYEALKQRLKPLAAQAPKPPDGAEER